MWETRGLWGVSRPTSRLCRGAQRGRPGWIGGRCRWAQQPAVCCGEGRQDEEGKGGGGRALPRKEGRLEEVF